MAVGTYEWRKNPKDQFGNLVNDPAKAANPMDPNTPGSQGTANPAAGSPFGVSQANRDAMGGGSMFSDLVNDKPHQATPSFNDLMGGFGGERNQAVGGAYDAINKGLNAPAATGPSQESQIALNDFDKQAAEARRAVEEKSALAGRVGTGQISGDLGNFISQQALPQRADLSAKLEVNDQNKALTQQQNSFSNLLGLEGLGSSENIAGKQIQAGKEAQAATIASNEKMQDKSIASTEKLGLADLSIREKTLAQNGQQFTDELSFKKYALENGNSQAEADRTWQAMENEKNRTATASESALGRELQKYIADSGLQVDSKKLEEQVREFNTKQAFDESSLGKQLDEAAKDRIWKSNEADIQRKFDAGQTLTEQEHEVNLERLKGEIDTGKMQLQQTLNLDTLEKQQAHDKIMAGVNAEYQTLRDNNQFSHEEAMEATKNSYATKLEEMGYSHDLAIHAADIAAKAIEGDKQRANETLLAKAELAQKSDFFAKQLGLDQSKVDLARDRFKQDLVAFGVDQNNKDYDKQVSIAATLSAIAGDDPDAQRFAAETFFKSIAGSVDKDGKSLVDPSQINKGMLGIAAADFKDKAAFEKWAANEKKPDGSPKYTDEEIKSQSANVVSAGTNVAKTQDYQTILKTNGAFKNDAAAERYQGMGTEVQNALGNIPVDAAPDTKTPLPRGFNDEFAKAIVQLRKNGVPEKDIQAMVNEHDSGGDLFSDQKRSYSATKGFAAYANYLALVSNGLDPDNAKKAVASLYGPDLAESAAGMQKTAA